MTIVPRPFLWNVDAALRELTAWKNWTPTVTQSGALAGITVSEAKYAVVGKVCHIYAKLVIADATGAVGNNQIVIGGLPAAAQAAVFDTNYFPVGEVLVVDSGTSAYLGHLIAATASTFKCYDANTRGMMGVSPNFQLANTDAIYFSAAYRAS